jgi:hypothetical protein
MDQITCKEVRQWLETAARSNQHIQPSPALQVHVGGCAMCKGALLLLVATAAVMSSPETIDCQDCLDNLPSFVDHEQDDPIGAVRVYPQVWWHLWTCQECSETYHLTSILLAAEQRGELSPFPSPTAKPTPPKLEPSVLLRLTRQFLRRALPPPMLLAPTMRGQSEGPVVLSSCVVAAGRQLTLSVQEQSNGDWSVSVDILPPQSGWAVLVFGDKRFRTLFDTQGAAVVAHVPATLLASTAGPDLVVEIEPI